MPNVVARDIKPIPTLLANLVLLNDLFWILFLLNIKHIIAKIVLFVNHIFIIYQ
jgi:hypothetical protein